MSDHTITRPETDDTPGRLTIKGIEYTYQTIEPSRDSGVRRCIRLVRQDTGSISDVALHANGMVACDCGDFLWRRSRVGENCKHMDSVAELGLFGTPDLAAECDPNEPADLIGA